MASSLLCLALLPKLEGGEVVAVAGLTMVVASTLQVMMVTTKVVLVAPTKVGRTRTLKPTINTASTKIKC